MQYEENKTRGNCSPDGAERNPGYGYGRDDGLNKKAPVETGA